MDSPDTDSRSVRWLDLAERISFCGRLLRTGLDRRLEACGLGAGQFSILWACHETPSGAGQSALAEMLAVSPAHVSGLVEQLRGRGLLVARRPASDRRRQLWQVTPEGQLLVEKVLAELCDWAERLEGRVPESASRALRHLVEQLTGALAEQTAPAAKRKGAA
jgi:DNA-binding MarR family transcriptional regulator